MMGNRTHVLKTEARLRWVREFKDLYTRLNRQADEIGTGPDYEAFQRVIEALDKSAEELSGLTGVLRSNVAFRYREGA